MWPPACSPPGNVPPPSRRGGACPSRWFPEGFHFARRISPCGASFFPSDGKETKGSPGETHIAVGNRFPPAPVRSPPVPRRIRGPILGGYRTLSGAGGITTDPASAPLPLSVQIQDRTPRWTGRARLMAQDPISAGENRRAAEAAPAGQFRSWVMR